MKINKEFLFVICLFLVVIFFFLGMHGVDLAYNFKGEGMKDCNLFRCVSVDQMYKENYTFLLVLIIL